MAKKDKKERGKKSGSQEALVPIGFTGSMLLPAAPADPLASPSPHMPTSPSAPEVPVIASELPAGMRPLASPLASALPGAVPPLATVGSTMGATVAGPSADQVLAHDAQRRLVDMAVEKETLSVRLEDAARQRTALEERIAELSATVADLRAERSGTETERSSLAAERDKLIAENQQLQDEILRLPEELEAVTKSRAFRIIKAAPILAVRKPLSTLLIVGAMGALANLWDFSNLARTLYLVVGGVVLLVSAIQFLARND